MNQETEYINVYGARVHNLKNIDVKIPRCAYGNHRLERKR